MPITQISPQKKVARLETALQRSDREARIDKALKELAMGLHKSIAAAARSHNLATTTLQDRRLGRPTTYESHAHQQTLSPPAEASLCRHIVRCSVLGFPLTPAAIVDLAETALQPTVDGCSSRRPIGRNWFQRFLLRHPELTSKWSRCLENSRMKAATVEGIRAFYGRLEEVIGEYNVRPDLIFNMDETGFMMGYGGKQKVVVPVGPKAARFKSHIGSRENTTVVECIGSGGQVPPPLIIFKGKWHLLGDQRQMVGVEKDWHFGMSINGWTSCDLALAWLRRVFDPATTPRNPSNWRLLVLDGHTSHVSVEFLDYCWSRRIAPLCLPPHSTHLMQPLDVSIFGPLTDAYRRHVIDLDLDITKVTRTMFTNMYVRARAATMTPRAARKAFVDCGYSPHPDADKVLQRLPGYQPPPMIGPREQTPPRVLAAYLPVTTPGNHDRFRRLLDDLDATDSPQLKTRIRTKLLKAFESKTFDIILLEEQGRAKAGATPRADPKAGDRRCLSKDMMITREEAEEWLAADAEKQREQAEQRQQQQDASAQRTVTVTSAVGEAVAAVLAARGGIASEVATAQDAEVEEPRDDNKASVGYSEGSLNPMLLAEVISGGNSDNLDTQALYPPSQAHYGAQDYIDQGEGCSRWAM